MTGSLRAAVVGIALLVAGCQSIRPWDRSRLPDQGTRRPSEPVTVAKRVSDKREATVLVAIDGTICYVTREVWNRVRIGDSVVCRWFDDG